MEGFQWISCVRFSLQLMAAQSVFLLVFPRRKHFILRLAAFLLAFFALLYGVYTVVSRIPGDITIVRMLYYTTVFVMTLGVMQASFNFTSSEMLFAAVGGYATQHMTYVLVRMFEYFVEFDTETFWGGLVHHWVPYMVFPLLMYFLVIRNKTDTEELNRREPRMILLALLVLTLTIVISLLSSSPMVGESNQFMFRVVCSAYALLCCVLMLFLLFYIPREARLRHESEIMEQMIRAIDERQQISKKNVEIINRKCHDIKYQLRVLLNSQDEDERKGYAEEITQAIAVYETIYQTGNVTLDDVLSERGPVCQEYGIQFSCIADGGLLNFMQPLDVTTFFGNALDNAIESVLQELDAEKRIINLHVARQGQMVHVHIENYCKTSLEFEDGLPVTTKPEKEYHGFGVKSIRHIADKYDAILVFQQQAEKFVLDMLCPLP